MTNFILAAFTAAALTAGVGAASLSSEASSELRAAPATSPERAKDGKKGQRHGKIDRFCDRVECSDAQKRELQEIFASFRSETKDEREQIRSLRKQLNAEFAKDRPNENSMKRTYAQIDRLQDGVRDEKREMMMDVHGVLEPGQREAAAKMLMKGKKHHGKKAKKAKPAKPAKKAKKAKTARPAKKAK